MRAAQPHNLGDRAILTVTAGQRGINPPCPLWRSAAWLEESIGFGRRTWCHDISGRFYIYGRQVCMPVPTCNCGNSGESDEPYLRRPRLCSDARGALVTIATSDIRTAICASAQVRKSVSWMSGWLTEICARISDSRARSRSSNLRGDRPGHRTSVYGPRCSAWQSTTEVATIVTSARSNRAAHAKTK